jgi:hypothetical protein
MGSRDVPDVDLSLHGHLKLDGMQDLSQDQHDPELLQDQGGMSTPPQADAQGAFEQFDGQFDIPTSGVELGNLLHAELAGIEHIGQVLMQLRAVAKLDQPDRMSGLIGTVGPEADDSIQVLAIEVSHLDEAGGSAFA